METLKPLIEELVKMVQNGKNIVSGNLPEVMKQIIAYDSWSAHLWIKLSIGLFVLGILLFVLDCLDNSNYNLHGFSIFGAIILAVSVIIFMVNYSTLKKIEMAPKVYMIDVLHGYLAHEH